MKSSLADTKVSEEGGGRGAPGTGAKVPLRPVERTMVEQVVPLQPMVYRGGAGFHAAVHGGDHG